MKLDLTPQEARILYNSLQDYMDDQSNDVEDLELAGRLSFVLKESLNKKSKKSIVYNSPVRQTARRK